MSDATPSQPPGGAAPESDLEILRLAAPFRDAPQTLLRQIAALGRHARYQAGEPIYTAGEEADDIYVTVSGRIEHIFTEAITAQDPLKRMTRGGVFGWAGLLLGHTKRLATATARDPSEVIAINTEKLVAVLEADRVEGGAVMDRFAAMIQKEFQLPDLLAQVRRLTGQPLTEEMSALGLTMYRLSRWITSPRPYLMLVGLGLFISFWYLSVEVWKLPRFREMPGITTVFKEWTSANPTYGLSFYTPEYYHHILVSIWRVAQAFFLATLLGVPVGLFLGWSRKFKEYAFPIFEMLRPIPILAWVPLAIVMFVATESAVIFLAFLASFFATALNTMLGVESIDESYTRAANCLGASKWQVFRHVIVPGALPFIFTGLQISIGVSWFSLVAAEMVSGQFGLGYVINTSYMMVRYPTIVIGMITLGVVGYVTSALVRIAGDYLMQWRVRELALSGG